MYRRALMVVGLIVVPVLGQAQTGADSVAIVEAAARWYASQAPTSSRVVGFLLPGRHPTDPALTPSQIEAAQHGARILGATLIPYESFAKLCNRKKPGDCGPGKFDLLVGVRVYQVTGNASEVFIDQYTNGEPGPRRRDSVLGYDVLFVRSGDGWAFDRILRMSAS